MQSTSTAKLSTGAFTHLLRSSCLLVPSEYYLYQMCEQWLMAQEQHTADILTLIDDILAQIRFYQMTGSQERRWTFSLDLLVSGPCIYVHRCNKLLMVEDSVLGSRYRTTVQEYLNRAYRHRIISAERPPAACERCMPRDYTDHDRVGISFLKFFSSLKEVNTFWLLLKCRPRTTDSSTQLYYQPRNRAKSIEPTKSPCHKWEVTPRKYYDTLNIVVVLKSRLGFDARIWISIVIFDREGRPSMRLRRRPFQIREPLRSVSQVISSRRTQHTLN